MIFSLKCTIELVGSARNPVGSSQHSSRSAGFRGEAPEGKGEGGKGREGKGHTPLLQTDRRRCTPYTNNKKSNFSKKTKSEQCRAPML